jgi:uncharacterized protein (UPF0333 family)
LAKKAQFAVEYLLVVGIGLVILIPSLAMFYNYSSGQTEEAIVAKIGTIGRSILNNAETVYYMGPPSRRTLELEFPRKIHNFTIQNITNEGKMIYILNLVIGDKESNYPFISEVPISGPYFGNKDQRCEDHNYACYSSGKKRIILDAGQNNVSIIIS